MLDKCPDVVTSVIAYADYSTQGVDQIKPTVDLLTSSDPRFIGGGADTRSGDSDAR